MQQADTNHPFTEALLQWFSENGRDLPWRHTTHPYPIWLSEVILQQTRISQGMEYWKRFMDRFPTVESLASADEDEVLRLWQGLGYYSRARNLRCAAKQIVESGHFPDTFESLKKLRGVGEYTASAIASIAYGIPTAVVDGNVYRVLSRYFGIDSPIDSKEGKEVFKSLAQSLVPRISPGIYNQAVMDFGAIVCTPSAPCCHNCLLQESCDAHRNHRVSQLPVKIKKTRQRKRHLIYIYIRYAGETVMRKRPTGDIWAGLWEPLLIEGQTFPELRGKLYLLEKGVRHILTHQEISADFYLLEATEKPTLPSSYRWMAEEAINQYGHSRLVEKMLEHLKNFVPDP